MSFFAPHLDRGRGGGVGGVAWGVGGVWVVCFLYTHVLGFCWLPIGDALVVRGWVQDVDAEYILLGRGDIEGGVVVET